jgi:hypothetical protein
LAHAPLAELLRKDPMPARLTLSGVGGMLHFPVFRVRLTPRVEPRVHKPVWWVRFTPRGASWTRSAGKAAHNGAGVRTLSNSWRDWVSWKPGAYNPEAVPKGWSWVRERGSYVVIDPGIRLPLACHNGLALPAGQWYQHRATAFDYHHRKPDDVRELERGMSDRGWGKRSWGLISFSAYLKAYYEALPTLQAYYGSRAVLKAQAWKSDKLRSTLDRLLMQLAPDPQVCCPVHHAHTSSPPPSPGAFPCSQLLVGTYPSRACLPCPCVPCVPCVPCPP